jgi:hypothetical protein
MNHLPSPNDDLLELIWLACDGTATDEQMADLAARLSSDPLAQKCYVQYVAMHADLQWDYIDKVVLPTDLPSLENPACSSSMTPAAGSRPAEPTIITGLPPANLGDDFPSALNPQAGGGFLSGGGAAFAVFFFVAIALLGFGSWLLVPDKAGKNRTSESSTELGNAMAAAPSGESVAQEKMLSSVRSIQFETGTATLGLDQIGSVVIEGPADFQMLSPMRARLAKGKIKVRVSELTGRGFQVETPNGLVTDLGTEFLLNVSETGKTDLAVLEGKVDFQASLSASQYPVAIGSSPERLLEGDGIRIDENGNIDRIVSIIRANAATFHSGEGMASILSQAVIVEVSDNLQKSDTKKFYEIVPGGLGEDTKAYVDTIHEWNGVTADGIPSYLIGADYVKTFNQNSIQKKFGMCVTLARPAKLYVFFDSRSTPPDWLVKDFRNTGDRIGLDATRSRRFRNRTIEVGPGNAIDDQFTIWEREVHEPCKLRLGTNLGTTKITPGPAMYGVAAVPLELPREVSSSETVLGKR